MRHTYIGKRYDKDHFWTKILIGHTILFIVCLATAYIYGGGYTH